MDFVDIAKELHILGIGGISLSALAVILKEKGKVVTGYDREVSSITQALQEKGILVVNQFDEKLIDQADIVVYTSALPKDEPHLAYAIKKGKIILSRSELLGQLAKKYFTISIAGSHGKTTATSMIGYMFFLAGKDPTIHVGGIMKNFGSNVCVGKGKYFITEACEYKDSFLSLASDIGVVLNEDPDHLDYFKTKENYYKSFEKFAKNTKKGGILIVNYDDPFSRGLKSGNTLSYAIKSKADVQAKNICRKNGLLSFDLFYLDLNFGNFKLKMIGLHNIYNALATIAVGIACSIPLETIKTALLQFEGVERRLEYIGLVKGAVVLHDYAHHPDEIIATIKAVKSNTNDRLICVFQPHTFSRTRDLYYEFCRCFACCDEVWLLPIYSAREKPIPKITSKFLAKGVSKYNKIVRYFSNFEKCYAFINKTAKTNTTFLIMGAGDIFNLAYRFKK